MFGTKSNVNTNELIKRDGWQCQYCQRFLPANLMTVDHVLPTSRGGADTLANTVISCLECNAQKGNKTLEEYAHYMTVRWAAERVISNGYPVNVLYEISPRQFSSISTFFLIGQAMGLVRLSEEDRVQQIASGNMIVGLVLSDTIEDVALIDGPLFEYYRDYCPHR